MGVQLYILQSTWGLFHFCPSLTATSCHPLDLDTFVILKKSSHRENCKVDWDNSVVLPWMGGLLTQPGVSLIGADISPAVQHWQESLKKNCANQWLLYLLYLFIYIPKNEFISCPQTIACSNIVQKCRGGQTHVTKVVANLEMHIKACKGLFTT